MNKRGRDMRRGKEIHAQRPTLVRKLLTAVTVGCRVKVGVRHDRFRSNPQLLPLYVPLYTPLV